MCIMFPMNNTSLNKNFDVYVTSNENFVFRSTNHVDRHSKVDLYHVSCSWNQNNGCARYLVSSYLMHCDLSYLLYVGAGQMGLGIAYVATLRAKVPVLLVDRSPIQIQKSLSLMDKLLAKDVSKGKLTEQEAKDAKGRLTVVPEEEGINGLKDVDLVVEVSYVPSYL